MKVIFTPKEHKAILDLYKEAKEGTFAKRLAEEILPPIIPRINKSLGNENNPLFWAYVIEHNIKENRL